MKRLCKTGFIVLLLAMCLSVSDVSQAAKKKTIKLSPKTITISVGQKKTLRLKNAPKPTKAQIKKVKWKSSNKRIVKVSPNKKNIKTAKITGVKPGKATIKVKFKGKTYKCKVVVKKKADTPSGNTVTFHPESHIHAWDNGTIKVSPTCEKSGIKEYKCSCGQSLMEIIPATGHSFNSNHQCISCQSIDEKSAITITTASKDGSAMCYAYPSDEDGLVDVYVSGPIAGAELNPHDQIEENDYTFLSSGISNDTIKHIYFLNRFKCNDAYYMFYHCTNLESVDLSNIDFSGTESACAMFECCGLKDVKFGNNTFSNCKSFSRMFYQCENLESLNLDYHTEKAEEMDEMFRYCESLKNLDISSFDTKNVTNMQSMFEGCKSMTDLDLSSFDTSSVTDMSDMFSQCSVLKNLDISHFKTSNVTSMEQMFYRCEDIQSLDVSSFDTSNVTTMKEMFSICWYLKEIKGIENFNLKKTKDVSKMFEECALTKLDASNWNPESLTDTSYLFKNCSELTTLKLGKSFQTSQVKNMECMFGGCNSLTSLDVSGFDTSNVENMADMFDGCQKLTSLDVSNFNTAKVKYFNSMFSYCAKLSGLSITNFNTENARNMRDMFYCCSSLTALDVSSFHTSKVYDMTRMFYGCEKLKTLDLSSFSTAYLDDTDEMFGRDKNLTKVIVSKELWMIPEEWYESKNMFYLSPNATITAT